MVNVILRSITVVLLTPLFLLLPGCRSSDSTTNPADEEQPFVMPTSADAMVIAYREAWQNKDYAAYEELLATGFKFVLSTRIAQDFQWGSDHVARVDDLAMADSIFETVTAIFMALEPRGAWEVEDQEHEHFAGILRREYEVHAEVHDPTTGVTYIVEGNIVFYATSRDVSVDGEQMTHWYLAGQQDLWSSKAVETCSLSLIKMLWR